MATETPYRLSIASELEAFRPELEYACDFLDSTHFVRRVADASTILHYGAKPPPGAIHAPSALFPLGVILDNQGIGLNRSSFSTLAERQLVPCAGPSQQALGYDALGLIFFMLSRIEERGSQRDRYGRFRHEDSMVTRHGWMLDPPADRAAADLATALTGQASAPARSRYEVYLTHDVDILGGYHRALEPLRWALGDALRRRAPAAALSRLYYGYFAGEPWTSIRALMSISEKHGAQSHFYFMGPSAKSMDSPYALARPELLRRIADEIAARGHAMGFHPGYGTAADPDEWRQQHAGLERILGQKVREGRQHVLQYEADMTPDIWNDFGMTLDCTLSYPEEVGFRAGTCRLFRAYSLRDRRKLSLTQSSTAIMDFGLFGGKYRDMPVEDALSLSLKADAVCRQYGGQLTVLYHTFNHRQPQWNFYQSLLGNLFSRPA